MSPAEALAQRARAAGLVPVGVIGGNGRDQRDRLPLLVLCCGVCGRGFPDEPGEKAIRAHTNARDKDGDQHDGEPWTGHTLNPGDEFVWAPHVPHGFESCRFVGFDGADRVYIVSRVRPYMGEVWVDPALFAEMVFPGSAPEREP